MSPNPTGNVALSALVAAIPIAFLFVALAVLRMKGHVTAVLAALLGMAVAVLAFGMPARLAGLATAFGMLYGLWPVAWVVVAAVFLFNLSVETGQFEIVKSSLASITDDRRLQVLLVAFSFGAFLEGAAGFGTPVAISGAMLVGLGFDPLRAAGLCLLANTAPVAFGAIGIPVLVAGQVSGVDPGAISQMVGRTLPVLSVTVPFYLVILLAGPRKGLEVWPAALVTGGAFALGQSLTAEYLGPLLPDVVGSIASIVCLTLFLRVWHPEHAWRFDGEAPSTRQERLRHGGGQVFRAWAPFLVLSILVGAWGVKPVAVLLDAFTVRFALPGLAGMVVRGGSALPAVVRLDLLGSAGTAILLTALVSLPVMGCSAPTALRIFGRTLRQLRFTILTIPAILGFAYILNWSGMANALGNAFAETGRAFPLLSPFLGWIGVLVTGSDTSANALFGKLQQETATRLGIDPVVTVAANTTGGGCAKMVSPQSLAVATGAVGLVGKESDLFRFTLKHSLVLGCLVAVVTFLESSVLGFLVPAHERAAAAAGDVDPHVGIPLLVGAAVVVGAVVAVALAKGRKAVRAETGLA